MSVGERLAVNTDEALLAHLLLTCCCAAWFLISRGLILVCGPLEV